MTADNAGKTGADGAEKIERPFAPVDELEEEIIAQGSSSCAGISTAAKPRHRQIGKQG